MGDGKDEERVRDKHGERTRTRKGRGQGKGQSRGKDEDKERTRTGKATKTLTLFSEVFEQKKEVPLGKKNLNLLRFKRNGNKSIFREMSH